MVLVRAGFRRGGFRDAAVVRECRHGGGIAPEITFRQILRGSAPKVGADGTAILLVLPRRPTTARRPKGSRHAGFLAAGLPWAPSRRPLKEAADGTGGGG